ncbi:hypothetical protein RR46_14536 [Papilio xuthus]|uniref:Uncharacterized protein n=1 Tax=Papilio xuthus TaxID=66420 RepID=A0A194PCT4_PAPXU|nr:hypothetical protein RR46_14536 [Papilio xuthus]
MGEHRWAARGQGVAQEARGGDVPSPSIAAASRPLAPSRRPPAGRAGAAAGCSGRRGVGRGAGPLSNVSRWIAPDTQRHPAPGALGTTRGDPPHATQQSIFTLTIFKYASDNCRCQLRSQ